MNTRILLVFILSIYIFYSCQSRKGYPGTIQYEESLRKIEQQGLRFDQYDFAKQAEEGNVENVLLYLKAGMDPNPVFKAENPLARAVINGHYEVVNILLEHQADPDIGRRQNDISPLMYAAENGHTDIAGLLIEYGADIHQRQGKYTGGYNALIFAAANGHTEVIDLLLNKGADINQHAKNTRTTALHQAAQNREMETVRYLLEKGADKNLKDKKGRTALDLVNEEIEDGVSVEEYQEIKKILED